MTVPRSNPSRPPGARPPALNVVIDAAAVLDMREIDLFRLAYRHRWGRELDAQALERLFAAYMFERQAPAWVHDFATDVLERRERASLAPLRLEASRYRRLPQPHRHGRLIVASVILGGVVYAAMLTGTSYDPGTSAPIPCYRGTGFEALSRFANLIHGRPPSDCRLP